MGPSPAPFARDLVMRTAAQGVAGVHIRRLFSDPTGRLITMETSSRCFTPAMAEFVKLRDQWCTTPFCAAPIRHIDHPVTWADGGPTSLSNAAGKCEACNYATEAPGWSTTSQPGDAVRTTTPTGHDQATYNRVQAPNSQGPPSGRPPGRPDDARPRNRSRLPRTAPAP